MSFPGLDKAKQYHKIVVTGPQRSGTTIASQILADALNLRHIDESELEGDNLGIARLILRVGCRFVMQAPCLSRYAHQFAARPKVLVVFMHRSIEDIVASQERIGWKYEAEEKLRYGFDPVECETPISQIKYDFWEKVQKPVIRHDNVLDLDYESLSEDPLWIAQEDRREFSSRQWRLEQSG